jgi:hypothetical protein
MIRTLVAIAICAALCAANAFAQDNPPKTPEQVAAQQEIDKLSAEKALLDAQTAKFNAEQDADNARKEAEVDKIKAEKDLITAATPNIAGAPKGTVTFDDKAAVTIENTVKVYEAVNDAALIVAKGILNGRPKEGVIKTDKPEVQARVGLVMTLFDFVSRCVYTV